jgi:hypothetical protein
MSATATMQSIDRIQQRHDPEHEIPGAYCHPLVTWTDMELLQINLALIERCDQLERRIAELERLAGLANEKGF